MDPYFGYEIAIALIGLYGLILYLLYRAGRIGPERSLSLFGPALMTKTQRGRSLLDRWGRFSRFWSVIGDLGVTLAAIAMAVIVALLILGAITSLRLSPSQAPTPQEALGLPGINPIIPLGYGIVALVVGIVLHELMHGVIARSQKIGVKSLGILWFVIPIGAFVEQDDAEMQAASRRRRDRVAAAGVLANFALTVVFFVALSGLIASSVAPNANGVGIAYVESGTPAANVSLAAGDIITAIGTAPTPTTNLFDAALANSTPHETVTVTYYSASLGHSVTTSVVLATNPNNSSRGFLGVAVYALTPSEIRGILIWPPGSDAGPVTGTLDWLVLPLAGIEPVSGTPASYFHLTGVMAHVSPSAFWIGANLLYWLAWMNLLLGLSNALPLFPLDGGLLFRDFAASLAARVKRGWTAAHLDEFGGRAAAVSSVLVLLLLLWQFIVPRLL